MKIVLTTMSDPARSAELARQLVEERYAACVNIVAGVRSIYRWQGGIEDETELLLLIKTTEDRIDGLKARLATLHPYDVPEIIVFDPSSVSDGYLGWVLESVK